MGPTLARDGEQRITLRLGIYCIAEIAAIWTAQGGHDLAACVDPTRGRRV